MAHRLGIGIIAPSSIVSKAELHLGTEKLKEAGFKVRVHPQCKSRHLFFAGLDEIRAQAFYEYAIHPELPVLWCARGGYGSARLLPLLEEMTAKRGIPERKLLVGYSDITALHEFVRARWNWPTLHAVMPGLREFIELKASDWRTLTGWVNGKSVNAPWDKKKLRFFGKAPAAPIRGELVGGNFAVWTSLIGTSFAPLSRDKILFFEDYCESLYRIDRMLNQWIASGGLREVKAIILGSFFHCHDSVPLVLKSPESKKLVPLRRAYSQSRIFKEIFEKISERFKIPIAYGLPVGHGPSGRSALPLGAEYQLKTDGRLELLYWDWIGFGHRQ